MYLARLNTIDDVATLRAPLAEQWDKAAAYERALVDREQVIARHCEVIAERDRIIARHKCTIAVRGNGVEPIDNNPIQNVIRPIALGRKNRLFAGSETAGRRAAAIMSLLATAKANGHEPHAWLTDVLTRLPTTLDRDIDTLLPHRWQPAA